MTTDQPSYNSVAKFLHWTIALAIVFMLTLGWLMDGFEGSTKFAAFQLHKSVGITILLLSIFRLIWRMMHTAPPLPDTMNGFEKFAAHAAHILFYILIIGMPLTGWVMVSASPMNIPTILYGFIPWPHLPVIPEMENKREVGHLFRQLHGLLAYVMAGLIALHAAAAWKHHLFNRDDILLRMAPRFLHGLLHKIRGE